VPAAEDPGNHSGRRAPAPTPPLRDPIEAAVDDAALGAAHIRIFLACIGGTLLNGYTVFVTGAVAPLISSELGTGAEGIGLFGSALVLGAVPGSLVGGRLSDRIGRRRVFLVDVLVMACASLVLAMAPDLGWLIAAQLVLGFGIGMDFPVAAAYVAETMPSRKRHALVVATIAFQAVGLVLGAGATTLAASMDPHPENWRVVLGSSAGIALVFLVARLGLPESPHWSALAGHFEDVRAVVARLSPRAELPAELRLAPVGDPARAGYLELFRGPVLRVTLLTAGAWSLMDVATYGVGMFTPSILAALAPSTPTSLLAREAAIARASGVVDAFLVVGSIASIWVVHRFGPLRVQVVGFLGMAAGLAVLAAAPHDSARASAPLLAGFALFNLAQNAGPNATTFALPALLYPTRLRATGAGFASAFAKLGATLGALLLPGLEARFGPGFVLHGLAIVSLLALVVTVACRPRSPRQGIART
jgi:MFS family permease